MRQIVVDTNKCNPATCENGICAARRTCPMKALYQFEPGEVPVADLTRCRACSKCVAECPNRAIYVTS